MTKKFNVESIPFLKILLIALLLLHGLLDKYFKIDNTTILLILLFILFPYIPLIKKIKFGDFEAEITHEDVKNIENKIKQIPKKEEKVIESKKSEDLQTLAKTDPTLAMAKVRIEIEKKVRSLGEIYLKKSFNYSNLHVLVLELRKNGFIGNTLESLLQDVISVANRAIHGESIEKKDAERVIDYAGRVIEELDNVVIDHALKSESKKIITPRVVESHMQSEYILKTIIPNVKKPEMRIYRLNQTELDAFLTGYDEYAEFIISLEKSEK